MKWLKIYNTKLKEDNKLILEWFNNKLIDEKKVNHEKIVFSRIKKTFKKASYAGVKQILKRLNAYEKDNDIVDYLFCNVVLHGKGYLGSEIKPCVLLFRKDKIQLIYSKARRTSSLFTGFLIAAINELNPKMVIIDLSFDDLFNQEYVSFKYGSFSKSYFSLKANDNHQVVLSGAGYYFEKIKENLVSTK